MSEQLSDKELISRLAEDGEQVIDLLFRRYYRFVCVAVYRILSDENLSEDIAQEVFYELWKKRHRINIQTSLKAYLKRAAVNKSLNYIRDQKIKFEEVGKAPVLSTKSHNAQLEAKELQEQINLAVNALPERCRIIFSLSRFEEMSYQEIANTLQISTKTVENQISKALKILRQAIGPYLSKDTLLLLVFFYHFLS